MCPLRAHPRQEGCWLGTRFGTFSQVTALMAMLPRLDLNQKPCD